MTFANSLQIASTFLLQRKTHFGFMVFCSVGIGTQGHFPMALGQKLFTVLTVYYLIKWVEVEALMTITVQEHVKIIWTTLYTSLEG